MSIVRVGLAETKDFSDGYDAIFGKKDKPEAKPEEKSCETAKQQEKKEEKKK
jgi:hypothetical protein